METGKTENQRIHSRFKPNSQKKKLHLRIFYNILYKFIHRLCTLCSAPVKLRAPKSGDRVRPIFLRSHIMPDIRIESLKLRRDLKLPDKRVQHADEPRHGKALP